MDAIVDIARQIVGKMEGWQVMVTVCFVAGLLTMASPNGIKAAVKNLLRIKAPGGK